MEGVWIFFQVLVRPTGLGVSFLFQVLVCPTGPGGVWLSTASPNGSGGRFDFFKYWFAQRVWGFHFLFKYWSALGDSFLSTGSPNGSGGVSDFSSSTGSPNGSGGFNFFQVLVRPTGLEGFRIRFPVLVRPTGLEGFRIRFQVLVRPTGLGVSFFSSTGSPNGSGGFGFLSVLVRPTGLEGFRIRFQVLVRPTGLKGFVFFKVPFQLAEHHGGGQRGPAELRHRNHGRHSHHQHGQRRELHHGGRRVHGHADGLRRSDGGELCSHRCAHGRHADHHRGGLHGPAGLHLHGHERRSVNVVCGDVTSWGTVSAPQLFASNTLTVTNTSDFSDDLFLTKNWAGWSKLQVSNKRDGGAHQCELIMISDEALVQTKSLSTQLSLTTNQRNPGCLVIAGNTGNVVCNTSFTD